MSLTMFDGLIKGKSKRKPIVVLPTKRADSNAVLRKTIGKRFIAAREMNGWDQSEASEKLGYRKSTQLSLIEHGKRMPPPTTLLLGAEVYGVSMDFLFGLSDEPERDPKAAERQAAMRQVHALVKGQTEMLTTNLLNYISNGAPSVASARALLGRADALVGAVQTARDMNPKVFDDKLKGSARMVRACVDLAAACTEARVLLDRHERVVEFQFKNAEQQRGVSRPLFEKGKEA